MGLDNVAVTWPRTGRFYDPVPPVHDEGNVPAYWIRPPAAPSSAAGMHRFVWDLRYPPPRVEAFTFPIAATPRDTPRQPTGPWAMPGSYTVTLAAGDARASQPLEIRMDPRVKTAPADLEQQFTLSMQVYDAIGRVYAKLPRAERDSAPRRPVGAADSARRLHADLLTAYEALQDADVAPSAVLAQTVAHLLKQAESY